MKKAAAILSILFFAVMISDPHPVLASAVQIPLPQSAGLSQATAGIQGISPLAKLPETVGVACAVQGTVTAKLPGQSPRTLKSGMPVFMGEILETGPESRLQLLLKDESAFTLGPRSNITVDKFVYNESNDDGRIQASITKGVFRFITGRIAKKTPRNMTVKLPSAVIGVRGTIVAGNIEGESSQVILLGPGEQNNTGENPGSIYVSNDHGGENIFRSGYGTFIADDGTAPTDPALIPNNEIEQITDTLNSNPESGEQPESEAEATAENETPESFTGQKEAHALETASLSELETEFASTLEEFASENAQEATSNNSTQNSGTSGGSTAAVTTFTELRTKTGTGSATLSTGTLSPSGTFSLALGLNFSGAVFATSSSVSKISAASDIIAGSQALEFILPSQSYTYSSGNAVFTYTGLEDTNNRATADATFTFNNSGTDVAKTVTVDVTITDANNRSHVATGSGSADVV